MILSDYTHSKLVQSGVKVAVAESLTAGLVQAIFAERSGASAYLAGGVTAYTQDAKVRLLGVNLIEAVEHNCVSEEIARQMVAGVIKMFGSDWGIATTGYAEPDSALGRQQMAWVAVGHKDDPDIVTLRVDTALSLTRQEMRELAAWNAANLFISRFLAHRLNSEP